MIRLTIYSGPSLTDDRPPAVSTRDVGERDVHEELRRIGLEWKQADYMGQRQVVITLDPVAPAASPDERLREADLAKALWLADPNTDHEWAWREVNQAKYIWQAKQVLAALAADRGTACTDRENTGPGGAVTRGIVPSGTDALAATDRDKPEEKP